jgi:thiol-disulfide isomerase/thioredoxin
MKNISLIALLIVLLSCQKFTPPKDYVVLHGTIANPTKGEVIRLFDPISSKSIIIKVAEDGTYNDTLKVEKPTYYNAVYGNVFGLYLTNGMDLTINFDGQRIGETITFKGKGENENQFLAFNTKLRGVLYGKDYRELFNMEKTAFDVKIQKFDADFKSELEAKKSVLSPAFVISELKYLDEINVGFTEQFVAQQRVNAELGVGMASPEFINYINYKGGKTSLKDLRGSYVYIDVWATWCGPCKYEIPYLAKVEEQYHDKNIKFVSISVDRLADEKKWREMIVKQSLGGIQLLADDEIKSKFVASYYIEGIPHFILLDKEGKIINADAPRPSEPELIDLLNSQNL